MTEATKLARHETKRQEFIAGLRKLADFYEQRPGLRPPCEMEMDLWSHTKKDAAEIVQMCGACRTESDDETIRRKKEFGGGVSLRHWIFKEATCQKVKVGTRLVPAEPAKPAQPERVVDVYEWRCPDDLLKDLHRNGTPQQQPAEV